MADARRLSLVAHTCNRFLVGEAFGHIEAALEQAGTGKKKAKKALNPDAFISTPKSFGVRRLKMDPS